MSKHTIVAFRLGGDMVEKTNNIWLCEKIFITTQKDIDKIQSALNRWDEDYDCTDGCDNGLIYVPRYKKKIVAENITDKQLEKFNLDCPWKILNLIFKCDGMEYYCPEGILKYGRIRYVDSWNSEGNKKWWNDFKEELEEAKYNPRNVLGKLEFDRRAEADGIIWKDEE